MNCCQYELCPSDTNLTMAPHHTDVKPVCTRMDVLWLSSRKTITLLVLLGLCEIYHQCMLVLYRYFTRPNGDGSG